ncbi:MAG: ATPase [Coriobacteriia bacterium]|nr:ATPase [Coriobacteriia bacterium]
MAKYISAAGAMAVSAAIAGYAQARIGAAAAGTIAEKPEAATMLIVLQALPEIIVLLGFVSALIISG